VTTGSLLSEKLRSHTPRRDIQALRGIAVLAVVLFHAGIPIPGGFTGVDVFFVISGYVITAMLVRELDASGRIRFKRFYERRIRRLIPALTLVIAVTLALSFLLGSPFDNQQAITAQTGIGAITMTANAVVFLNTGGYFATPATNNPLLNTWSLSVEEQFYLVFPAILLLLWWIASKRTRLQNERLGVLIGLTLVVIVSFTLNVLLSFNVVGGPLSDPDWFAFYSSPTRAWEFGAGALAFLAITKPPSVINSFILYWVGVLGLVVSFFWISESMVFPGWVSLIPVFATVALLVGGMSHPRGHSLLTNRPLVVLGDSSYSWYLWHWPIIAFGVMLFPTIPAVKIIVVVLSLGLALATTRYLENPIRFSTKLTSARSWGIFASSVGLIVVLGGLLLTGARASWWNPAIQSMESQVSQAHLWITSGCNSETPLGQREPNCTWNLESKGEPIYLVGDSLAGALSEGVLGAGQTLGRPILAGTKGACPFVNNSLYLDGNPDSDCNTFVEDSTLWLTKQAPGDDVLSSSLGYLTLGYVSLAYPAGQPPESSFDGKTIVYLEGLQDTVQRLVGSGHRVHVVLPPPGFPQTIMDAQTWYPSQCNTFQALRDIDGCGENRTETATVNETDVLFNKVRTSVESVGGTVTDLRDQVCVNSVCATNENNFWKYLDGSHISVGFSESLSPTFESLLRKK